MRFNIPCFLLTVFFIHFISSDDVFTNRFADIRFTPYFIDKTLFIYEVFKFTNLSLNAPYKFGKSSNIGMLNMFLSNLRTKETITEYFNGTEIWKFESFVDENMGEHPVILFNSSVCGIVYDEDHMVCTFQWVMHNTFLDHSYLLNSEKISKENKRVLEEFLDLKRSQCVKFKGITKGLNFLAQLLYEHHGKQVILLVDGFSRGVMERIIEDNHNFQYLSSIVVDYYNAIYNNTLLGQQFISRTVVSSETWLYGLRDPVQSLFHKVNFMEDPKFSFFYGFTYDELEFLLCKFDIPLEQRPHVLKWFCGYSSAFGDVKVCNPYSVLLFLKSPFKRIRGYWFGSPTGRDLLQRMVDSNIYNKHIHDLVFNNPINITVETLNITEEVGSLRQKIEQMDSDSQGFVFQVLKETGFLTYASHKYSGVTSLKFPNEEIRSVVDKFISLLSFI